MFEYSIIRHLGLKTQWNKVFHANHPRGTSFKGKSQGHLADRSIRNVSSSEIIVPPPFQVEENYDHMSHNRQKSEY